LKLLLPPFNKITAEEKVRKAENAWNTKDPVTVSEAYSEDSEWRNRDAFICGRSEIQAFLKIKWEKELDYKLRKELWAFNENRIAVRFEYEWRDTLGQWYRSYGNEMWQFNKDGYMTHRYASINDLAIKESERRLL
jgi:nuclear transport factor 2 (NTF2) superfamily protein